MSPEDQDLDRREPDTTEVVDLHEPIYRENAEPRDGYEPPPMWLWFFVIGLMGFGGWYLGMYSGGFDPMVYNEEGWVSGARPSVQEEVEAPDPMVLGKRVYNNCASCHQPDGTGVPGNYPPLDGSRLVTGAPDILAALVLRGLEGEIVVAGQTYNQVMPDWDHLTDEQIASVLTYVRSSWSNDAPPVPADLVAAVRDEIGDRPSAWTIAELESFGAGFEPPQVATADGDTAARSDDEVAAGPAEGAAEGGVEG